MHSTRKSQESLGGTTPLPSLELSTNIHSNIRETEYFETVSWLGPGYAATPEKDPHELWHRLFGKPNPKDKSVPQRRDDYLRLMGDLMILAFRQDFTRVATLLVDPERGDTPRMYHGVFDNPQNHHVLTHTKGDSAKAKLQKIDRFHVAQFAYVVEKMAATPDGEGTLLDHCAVALGSFSRMCWSEFASSEPRPD